VKKATGKTNWYDAPTKSLEQLNSDLDAHLAEDATGAHKAENIVVEDVNNHFTGIDVESVLSELFTFANDGKTGIAAVIGSPATSGDTFATLANHIQNAKNTMATNLTGKGVSASGTEALQALADKIANISTGKKWASGTTTSDSGYVSVTGLDFTPSLMILKYTSGGDYHRRLYHSATNFGVKLYFSDGGWQSKNIYSVALRGAPDVNGVSAVYRSEPDECVWYRGSGYFYTYIKVDVSTSVTWYAYE